MNWIKHILTGAFIVYLLAVWLDYVNLRLDYVFYILSLYLTINLVLKREQIPVFFERYRIYVLLFALITFLVVMCLVY